jgi:type VI secretion system protein ImpK
MEKQGTMRLTDKFTDILYFTVVNKDVDFGHFSLQDLYDRYRSMISKAEVNSRDAGISDSAWRNALFAVVSWIDEVIHLSDWEHCKTWQKQSLQKTFFHTANGGVEFYKRLESIDNSETEVLMVYDIIMSMGFKGELYRDCDAQKRQDIVERIVQLLSNNVDMSVPKTIFSNAYGKHIDEQLPGGRRKTLIMRSILLTLPPIVVVLTYLILDSKLSVSARLVMNCFH